MVAARREVGEAWQMPHDLLSRPPHDREMNGGPDLASIFNAAWRKQALEGNPNAVQALTEMVTPLYAFCLYRVGRNHHLCEEVVQETMLRGLRELTQYDPSRSGNNIFPWLTGLARNEIHRSLAHERLGQSLEVMWANVDRQLLEVFSRLEAEPLAEALLQRQETRELVNAAMSQLPEHYREALEAKYLSGKSVRDLAGLWGATEKAVESQLTRARKAFRATFIALTQSLGTGWTGLRR
jgi:RNA polymerase sigma-70 factor, ECF subfamily